MCKLVFKTNLFFFLFILWFLFSFCVKGQIIGINLNAKIDSLENTWYGKIDNYHSKVYLDKSTTQFNIEKIPSLKGSVKDIELYVEKIDSSINFLLVDTGFLLVQMLIDLYTPDIMPIIQQEDLPKALLYLPSVLSAFNPHYFDKNGGAGIWQLNYLIAKKYGLKVNYYIDQRRDIVKSSRAAVVFLKDLYCKYNDWYLAIGAFFYGKSNIHKAENRVNNCASYWQLYPYLPEIYRDVVIDFLAIYQILHEKELLQFNEIFIENYDTIYINKRIELEVIAKFLSSTLSSLKTYNSIYRKNIIPENEILYLPHGTKKKFELKKLAIYQWQDSLSKKRKQKKTYQLLHSVKLITPDNKSKIYYKVRRGDNLGKIAASFHVKVSDLKYWNGITGHIIYIGQRLVVYVPKDKVAHYKYITATTLKEKPKTIIESPWKHDGKYIYYTVKRGDTLWDIAKKFKGVSDTDIKKLNDLRNNTIYEGQKLKIK